MSKIYYHGSPVKFTKFKFNTVPNSRLGDGTILYLAKDEKIAKAFAFGRLNLEKGYLYTVEVSDNHSGEEDNILRLDDDGLYEILKIYNLNDVKIVKRKLVRK